MGSKKEKEIELPLKNHGDEIVEGCVGCLDLRESEAVALVDLQKSICSKVCKVSPLR